MVQIMEKNNSNDVVVNTEPRLTKKVSVIKAEEGSKKNTPKAEKNDKNNLSQSRPSFDDIDFDQYAADFIDFSKRIHTSIPKHKMDPSYHYVWKTEENAGSLLNAPNSFYEKAVIEGEQTTIDAGYNDKKGQRIKQVLLRCPIGYYRAIMKAQSLENEKTLQNRQNISATDKASLRDHFGNLSNNIVKVDDNLGGFEMKKDIFAPY